MVGHDGVGPGAPERGQGLQHGAPLVEHASGHGGLDHRVLARHVVGHQRQVEGVADHPDHVQVGQPRLDHQVVRALLGVEPGLAQRLAVASRRVHLVAPPVPETGGAARRVAEGAVVPAGVLDGVAHDRNVREARRVERRPDGPDLTVHHGAGSHDIGPGAGLGHGGAGQQFQRGVVVHRDLAADLAQRAAVAVVGVLAQAGVGNDAHPRMRRLDGPRRHLDDALVRIRLRALSIFGVGNAEQNHGIHAQRQRLAHPRHRARHAVARDAGHAGNRLLILALVNEHRVDELRR